MRSDKISKKLAVKDLIVPIFVIISITVGLALGTIFRSGSSVADKYDIPIGLFFMITAVAKIRLDEIGKSVK
ncbi:MAG: hypothetical protein QW340_03085 [Thermoplasmatales archaeon]